MLKKYDLHDKTWQPVENRDKSHDRTRQPVVKRDTRHELKHGLFGEELIHAETNPTCEIHESYCTSH